MPGTTCVRWVADGSAREGGIEMLPEARASGRAWIDVFAPDDEGMAALGTALGLHPLVVEGCLQPQRRAKIDVYEQYVFVVWIVPTRAVGPRLAVQDVGMVLGADFLVTTHRERLLAVDAVAAEAANVLRRGVDWTAYEIVDRLVDGLLDFADSVGDPLEALEDEMVDGRVDAEHLQKLRRVRSLLVAVHRVIGPERDVLRALAREEGIVSADVYRYLQDVGDHLARAEDSIETSRDVASGAMDVYLSAVSNKLNGIMKQLTIVATIFMPLTLISGIYGMNLLRGMWPPPDSLWGFGATIVLMTVIAAGMLLYFKRKSWW